MKHFWQVLLAWFLFVGAAACQMPREQLNIPTAQWREDLRWLQRELPERHANAFHSISRADFDAAVEEADRRLPDLDADQAWVALASLTARVGDAHTYVRFPSDCPSLPLVIGKFGTEYRVSRVGPGLERALGAQVLAIDDTPIERARELMRQLVPRNTFENRSEALAALNFTEGCVLRGVGITTSRNSARYLLRDDDGKSFSLVVDGVSQADVANVRWIFPSAEPQLFRRHPGEVYWQEYQPESGILYANVRSIRNLGEVERQLMEAIRVHSPAKLVIDLRQNPGGDYFQGLSHLVRPIAANSAVNQRGHLFVLIGPLTFSAAMANAVHFREMTNATLVGETIGVRPNEYSEPRNATLPNSHLTLRYSTRLYQFVTRGENAVRPDVEVLTSWEDYRAGKDPVLEWVARQ